jgi:DNA-directed RNA polymerase subunit E'/Rpb7
MSIILPYFERTLTSRIEVEPHKLNENIIENVYKKLRTVKEGRCNRYGYVAFVSSLVNVKSSEFRAEDLQAKPVFEVKYNCLLCIPQKDQMLIAQIQRISDSIICCNNGPIRAIIQQDDVNTNVFDVRGETVVDKISKQALEQGMFIRIRVITYKFLVFDSNIKVLARLEGIATDQERDKYFFDSGNDTITALRNKMSSLKA